MPRLITIFVLLCMSGLETLRAQYPLDASFGENGICDIYRGQDMIVLSNGNILVFDGKDPDEHIINIYGFDADGNALKSYGEDGIIKLEFEKPVEFRMAVAGEHNEWYMWFYNYDYSNSYDSIIRFNAQVERINEYGINGAAGLPQQEYYRAGSMLVTRSGELLVTGELAALTPNTYGRFVCQFTKAGALNPQFGNGGLVMVNDYETYFAGRSFLIERSDGGILVGNTVALGINQLTQVNLLNKWGVPDASFGEDGVATLTAATNESEYISSWYDSRLEVLYILTSSAYLDERRVWQLNWDGKLNDLFGANGYQKNTLMIGVNTIYKLSDGTFFFTGIDFIDNHFQWDAAVWKTSPDLTLLPWSSDQPNASINLFESEDLYQASDDRELRSVMHNDGGILVLVNTKFYNGYGEEFPSSVLLKLNIKEKPRTDMCPLLSVPVLSADAASSSFLLTLDPQASGSFTISVTDMMGRTVVPHHTVDLAPGIGHYTYPIPQDLPKGLYLLTIHADDCSTGIKFVK